MKRVSGRRIFNYLITMTRKKIKACLMNFGCLSVCTPSIKFVILSFFVFYLLARTWLKQIPREENEFRVFLSRSVSGKRFWRKWVSRVKGNRRTSRRGKPDRSASFLFVKGIQMEVTFCRRMGGWRGGGSRERNLRIKKGQTRPHNGNYSIWVLFLNLGEACERVQSVTL